MIVFLLILLTFLLIGALALGGLILFTGFSWILIPTGIDLLFIFILIKIIKRKKK